MFSNEIKGARLLLLQPSPISGLQAYKNGLQGLSATYVGLMQLSDIAMGDNGAGPRSLTVYNLTTTNGLFSNNAGANSSGGSITKVAGGNVEVGQVGCNWWGPGQARQAAHWRHWHWCALATYDGDGRPGCRTGPVSAAACPISPLSITPGSLAWSSIVVQ